MARGRKKSAGNGKRSQRAENYRHPTADSPMRPDVGTQAQFRKKKPPVTYKYDSSLSPALDWDGQNPAREEGEALIAEIAAKTAALKTAKTDAEREKVVTAIEAAAQKLRSISKPFLDWAGKAERLSFDVPTLPLFVHERLSTKAIIETLKSHKRSKEEQNGLFDLFADPQHSITDQVLRAYEHRDKWVNRMILGDSLAVMNSLLHYENLGGQVQMIYMDPPYGVKFGSNFQPFVRKRDVTHNDDDDMTREPEMVQAYRDTWEVGLHSYLTYLRDRLLLCRDLLSSTGTIFVQISDVNFHHLREVMDEVFGPQNFIVTLIVKKKGTQKGELVDPINDYLLWYAKDQERYRSYHTSVFQQMDYDSDVLRLFNNVELATGEVVTLKQLAERSLEEVNYARNPKRLLEDYPRCRLFASRDLTVGGVRKNQSVPFVFNGKSYDPGISKGSCWKHTAKTDDGAPSGMDRLAQAGRIFLAKNQIRYKRYADDFPYVALSNWWDDVGGAVDRVFAVQTSTEVVKRCLLMSTKPGDLVLDPTCGSGTTAHVAEQWGRRWITIDVSRVPLALARQRLLTATFPWYGLTDDARGPAGGFAYARKQNNKGEEIGGIVPHITSTAVANNEPPQEEVLVDRPEADNKITRVCGPFCFEATIPTPVDWEGDGVEDSGAPPEEHTVFVDRMLEVLRKSPVLRLEGNRTVTFRNIRPPAKSLSLSAEALVKNGDEKAVAFVFGPENGAVSEKLVQGAAYEAQGKKYSHLYVIGFAIQPVARELVENCEKVMGIAATYVQATPDLMMGDLLKNMRSSQIFSVCGMPEVELRKTKAKDGSTRYQVELLGLDVFDPITMQTEPRKGNDVPAWFLDTDYNALCFHVCQAFFPRTGAWESLRKALRGAYDEEVWDHLAGTVSAPFEAGEQGQVAVKVIDDRGNELMVVKSLGEAK